MNKQIIGLGTVLLSVILLALRSPVFAMDYFPSYMDSAFNVFPLILIVIGFIIALDGK